ncbi:MAG TPA: pilus assembly PilX N-terminal domain-containing protein [Candidatus Krumholzibacteria bacterium]|nr:pilus assembly PilX N-terminal domain-containing protein [Candidatus Krumholzibacteria bacterium]
MIIERFSTAVRNERGNALVMAILLVFAASAIGAMVALMSATDLKISGNQERTTEALFVAEAGMSEAIHRLGVPYPTDEVVGGQTINISIADAPPIDPDYKAYIMMTAPGANPSFAGNTMTAGTLQDLNGDVLQYSRDSGTADVVTVEHKWEDLDADNTRDPGEVVLYDPSRIPPENFVTGNPVDIITVTGRSGTTQRTIQAEVTRLKLVAKTLGAMYTDKAITVSGNSHFCGWNHDISIPAGTVQNACFAYHESEGHLAGVTTTGDAVDTKGSTDLDGSPTPTDTSPANPWYTLAEVLGLSNNETQEILDNADHTSIVHPLDGVTYIQGDATMNSTLVGHGLLYITGNATINGGFKYWGLIYIEGDCNITGTPWIAGSLIVKQDADFSFGSGNCGVFYSEEAISQWVGTVMPMVTLSWRDM